MHPPRNLRTAEKAAGEFLAAPVLYYLIPLLGLIRLRELRCSGGLHDRVALAAQIGGALHQRVVRLVDALERK